MSWYSNVSRHSGLWRHPDLSRSQDTPVLSNSTLSKNSRLYQLYCLSIANCLQRARGRLQSWWGKLKIFKKFVFSLLYSLVPPRDVYNRVYQNKGDRHLKFSGQPRTLLRNLRSYNGKAYMNGTFLSKNQNPQKLRPSDLHRGWSSKQAFLA